MSHAMLEASWKPSPLDHEEPQVIRRTIDA